MTDPTDPIPLILSIVQGIRHDNEIAWRENAKAHADISFRINEGVTASGTLDRRVALVEKAVAQLAENDRTLTLAVESIRSRHDQEDGARRVTRGMIAVIASVVAAIVSAVVSMFVKGGRP